VLGGFLPLLRTSSSSPEKTKLDLSGFWFRFLHASKSEDSGLDSTFPLLIVLAWLWCELKACSVKCKTSFGFYLFETFCMRMCQLIFGRLFM
jgi:hypothetical protein